MRGCVECDGSCDRVSAFVGCASAVVGLFVNIWLSTLLVLTAMVLRVLNPTLVGYQLNVIACRNSRICKVAWSNLIQ